MNINMNQKHENHKHENAALDLCSVTENAGYTTESCFRLKSLFKVE